MDGIAGDIRGKADRVFVAYGAGHFAKTLVWSAGDLFLPYFVHVHLGLGAKATGWLIFLSLLYSAMLDALGAIVVAVRPGFEPRVPRLQYYGAIATAIGMVWAFTPVTLSQEALLIWLFAANLLLRTGYAFYDLAQNALVSLLPESEEDATRYVKARTIISFAAKIIVGVVSFGVIARQSPRFASLAALAPMAVLVIAAAAAIRKRRIAPVARAARGSATLPLRLHAPILVAAWAQACLIGLVGRFVPFILDPASGVSLGPAITLATVIGGMAGPLVVPRAARPDARFLLAASASTLLSVAAVAVMLGGAGSAIVIASAAAFGVGMGATTAIYWSELAAVVRDYATRTGARTDLYSFALLTMVLKLSAAVSGLLFGYLLGPFERRHLAATLDIDALAALGGILFLLCIAAGAPARRRRPRPLPSAIG